MLIDTNIFIDYLRGDNRAKHFLFKEEEYEVSIISLMEVVCGLSNKKEINQFERFLKKMEIKVIPINEEISALSYILFKKYFHSSGIGIMDSLIAASSLIYEVPFFTLNIKHFKDIEELELHKPY